MSTKSLIELAIEFDKQFIDQKPFSLADTGVTHKLINDWDSKGLLNNSNDDSKWRKFNLDDLIWIRMIAKLRYLNLGVETINKIKIELSKEFTVTVAEYLNNPNSNDELNEILKLEKNKDLIKQGVLKMDKSKEIRLGISNLQYALKSIYVQKINISLNFVLPGRNDFNKLDKANKSDVPLKMLMFCPQKLEDLLKVDGYLEFFNSTFISISLNELIADAIININTGKLPSNLVTVSKEESTIIQAIRSGNYKTVTVKFDKESKPKMMELEEIKKIKLESRLYEIIHKGTYEDIEIKTQNGEVYHCTRKRKVKL